MLPITCSSSDGYTYGEPSCIGYRHSGMVRLRMKAGADNLAASLLKYVTRFSCDTFGFYVAAVYVQYGIQVVTRQFGQSSVTAGILGVL